MGWQDRPYNRERNPGSLNPMSWLINGSVSLGTWFGIDLRAHASLVIYIAFTLLGPGSVGGWRNAVTSMAILFISVLLHEFGHCFGSYSVGGQPSQILMHPLGGLASWEEAVLRPAARHRTTDGPRAIETGVKGCHAMARGDDAVEKPGFPHVSPGKCPPAERREQCAAPAAGF